MAGIKKRGRKPGSLVHFTCCRCGERELVSGGGTKFVCSSCWSKGLRAHGTIRAFEFHGRDAACNAVAKEIRAGRLPHPSTMPCADCAAPATEYDHRDYNKPLSVEPVCRPCNSKRGPGAPLRGYFSKSIEMGVPPYRNRVRGERALRAMGSDPRILSGFPRLLNVNHWASVLDLIEPTDESTKEPSHA